MEIDEALAWLDGHLNLETGVGIPAGQSPRRVLTLDRIRSLASLLGSPQLEYAAVHVTGTNGKTTTTRIAAALLAAGGLSVGTFTSPHLERVNERIGWNGAEIPDGDLADVLTRVAAAEQALGEPASWFELNLAAALTWFADVAVDVAVVEVGMGGRWDATNGVVDGAVAVVTNISLDHVQYLGSTRADIAADKAAIVRPGARLVLGETDPDLVPLFLAREPAAVAMRDRDFAVVDRRQAHGGWLLDLRTPRASYDDVLLPLHGRHQADNAAVGLAAGEELLGRPLAGDVVREAMAAVTSPGRLEVVGHQPLVLLDGAHNVAGAHALRDALHEEFPDSPRTLVVGLLQEKDPDEMLAALGLDGVVHLVACPPPTPRALAPDAVAAAAARLGLPAAAITVAASPAEAVARALALTGPDGQVVVTGSLYTVGAARAVLRG